MTDTPNTTTPIDTPIPLDPSASVDPGSSFLAETPASQKSEDTLYNDFFQENNEGELTLGAKKERSGLELIVSILEYATIFVVIIGILSALHVSVRSIKSGSFLENYQFFCPYLNYDIDVPESEKGCKSVSTIGTEYIEKNTSLEENILSALTEYIPIKVSSSILDASPEKKFIIQRYITKPHVNDVLEAFESVKTTAQKVLPGSDNSTNIKCTGITVTEGNILSTQCVIYGGAIGSSNINGGVGSARIEALTFLEKLADTTKSSLILYNYPTTLSIDTMADNDSQTPGFVTRTTIPIQVGYVPLTEKL